MQKINSLDEALKIILNKIGPSVRMATPLGLGKPNQLINLIYQKAKEDSQIKLKIFTALSLDFEPPKNEFEKRFLGPFYQRHFKENYPHLSYVKDLKAETVPSNIEVHEFYMQAGMFLNCPHAQQKYISLNYTHVAPAIYQYGINLVVQLIAKSADGRYSLSCNPDLTLDVKDLYHKNSKDLFMVAVVHPDLPFLGGDAEVSESFFDIIIESPEVRYELFALPKGEVREADHMIGLYASQLVADDGTLQIGIGSLSDALVHSSLLRHKNNSLYQEMIREAYSSRELQVLGDSLEPFEKGIYGTSEMLMDGFMHLRRAGILKREIYDHDESAKRYLHGAFFLGSKEFYQWLRDLGPEDFSGLSMTRVSKVNDLYDPHEMALRRQRRRARFFNICMNMSLFGGAASDTLDNGQVVSGVGGQYNFVAMAHELEDAQSVLLLRSTRVHRGKLVSNIIPGYRQETIPRHLRDVVVTEYGMALLRGQTDEEVIKRLIEISHSDFQNELIQWAKENGKLAKNYELPLWAQNNRPEKIKKFFNKYRSYFPQYPFGSDFTSEEIKLSRALLALKRKSFWGLGQALLKGLISPREEHRDCLARMGLYQIRGVKEYILQKLLLGALK